MSVSSPPRPLLQLGGHSAFGEGPFSLPQAAWLWQCLTRVSACSPPIQASAAAAVASSVAISAPPALPLLSPPASAAPPAAATWWWAPPTPAAPAPGWATASWALRGARVALRPARTSRNRNAPSVAPRTAGCWPPENSLQMCTFCPSCSLPTTPSVRHPPAPEPQ